GLEDGVVHDRHPLPLDQAERLGHRGPAAVLGPDEVVDVGQVDQLVLVSRRLQDGLELEQVVAGAGRRLGRQAGGDGGVLDVVDLDVDLFLVAPALGVLVEPVVVGWDEVAPEQDLERGAGLRLRRRAAGGGRCPGRLRRRGAGRGGCGAGGRGGGASGGGGGAGRGRLGG